MKLLGDPIFARDATGRFKSRIGTVFLKTPGLVTLPGIHVTQRLAWAKELDRARAERGQPPLTSAEFDEEMAHSVDLIFDEEFVLIRPDPFAMELAFEADEALQTLVSKRKIRFLNTHLEDVRNALRARGENWRMSRLPVSPEEINRLIAASRTNIDGLPLYFYNRSTGSRFLALGTFAWLAQQPDDVFRKHLAEIVHYTGKRNRFGHPEIDIFPPGCVFTRQAFEALDTDGLSMGALRAAYCKLLDAFRQSVPVSLQDDTTENIEWRNLMCSALTLQANATASDDFIQGISPEFYMQIEWLPGCRIENGELIFDAICEELEKAPNDPELQALCDSRAKAIIFNYVRELGTIEYINIGRIGRSLSTRSKLSSNRANVYLVQVKEVSNPEPELRILRFQKWDVSTHLDEGKDLLRSIMESMDYTDYILDRRLGCRQLGMNLPLRVVACRLPETYDGTNMPFHGARCWAIYFERAYIHGYATDKISPRRYSDPEFNRRFARMLGEAAAVNSIVGRAYLDREPMFDDGDEVIVCDDHDRPDHLMVADHTGAFTEYVNALVNVARGYAAPVNKRAKLMNNAREFAELYLAAFKTRFELIQQEYQRHKHAFDNLFKHRPLDRAGSISYRWQCILLRLEGTDAAQLTTAIRNHIEILNP